MCHRNEVEGNFYMKRGKPLKLATQIWQGHFKERIRIYFRARNRDKWLHLTCEEQNMAYAY